MHPMQKPDIAYATVNMLLRWQLLDGSIVEVLAERTRGRIVANPLANRQLQVSKTHETQRHKAFRTSASMPL
jgi:hypothetical protein